MMPDIVWAQVCFLFSIFFSFFHWFFLFVFFSFFFWVFWWCPPPTSYEWSQRPRWHVKIALFGPIVCFFIHLFCSFFFFADFLLIFLVFYMLFDDTHFPQYASTVKCPNSTLKLCRLGLWYVFFFFCWFFCLFVF